MINRFKCGNPRMSVSFNDIWTFISHSWKKKQLLVDVSCFCDFFFLPHTCNIVCVCVYMYLNSLVSVCLRWNIVWFQVEYFIVRMVLLCTQTTTNLLAFVLLYFFLFVFFLSSVLMTALMSSTFFARFCYNS